MEKYQRRSQAEWQNIFHQQKTSGLNVVAFCQQHKLSSKTYYKRRRDLNALLVSDVPTAPFIKMAKPVQAIAPADTVFVLHYANSQLHIQSGSDVQWLAKLMQALS